MLKKNGGITLIALVITIIVLLILAGVSIAMLSGENGLLNRSSQAADKQIIAGAKDDITTAVAAFGADWYEERYVNNNTALGNPSSADKSAYIAAKLKTYVTDKSSKVEGCDVTFSNSDKTVTVSKEGAGTGDVTAVGNIQTSGSITWNWATKE